MLLRQLPRLGARGAAPLARFSGSFGAGAIQLPAAPTARSAEACPSVKNTRSLHNAASSGGIPRFHAAQAAAAAEMCSGVAAHHQFTLHVATTAAAKECRMVSTSSSQLLTAAAGCLADRSPTATAPSARGPWWTNSRSSVSIGTKPAGVTARGYAGVAPPPRDPRFATLEEADLEAFRGMLGARHVLTDASALQAVNKCALSHMCSV